MPDNPFFVINPNAANGRVGKNWPALKARTEEVLGPVDFELTKAPGDASRIAREAVEVGHKLVVSCGGDGTHNEVVNGLIVDDKAVNPDTVMGLFPMGTGGDLRRTVGAFGNVEDHLSRLKDGSDWRVDIGRIDFVDFDGGPAHRYFINIGSCGLSGMVDLTVNHTTKFFGGRASFFIGTLRAMARYTYPSIEIRIDEGPAIAGPMTTIAVANGQFFGGGMHFAPQAKMDDGLFDIIINHKSSFFQSVAGARDVYAGKHLRRSAFEMHQGKTVEMTGENVYLDVDGEVPGKLPATFRIIASALALRVSDSPSRGMDE